MRATSPALPSARRLVAAAAAAAAIALGTAPVAQAAPGDNGDVKVHDSTTPVSSQNDDPKVCRFYFDAFNFDTVQQVNWTVEQQPPTGTAQVLSGSITLVGGTGATGLFSLPDGHYKLEWTFVGENGNAKQKVFDVSCATSSPSPSGSPSSSPSGSPSPSSSPSSSPSGSTSPSVSPSGSPSPGHSPSVSPSGGPHGGVGTGGGGTSGGSGTAAVEVIGGLALVVGAGGLGIRAMRRRPGRNAES
ncbi:hypothetical protein ABTZ03_13330 [Kitasatospora sp. NPDC096077]|uniref:hypothetical protein n=1 Tax=Kitasatospora sp. NPDC096077 TaxID=3155544 RepID=UPI003316C75E